VKALTEIPSRSEVAWKHKARDGLVAGVLPIHYPRELLRAFNILPMEIWGPPQVDATYGSAHVQPYICSVVRNALSFLKTAVQDTVDLVVVPHACDSLQGLGSLLLDFVQPEQPVIPLYLPRGSRGAALDFLADELRSVYTRLEAITDKSPCGADLMESVRREEQADGLLVRIHQRRRDIPLTDFEFYRLIRAREFLPAEEFSLLAERALGCKSEEGRSGIPVILSGIVPEPMGLFNAISDFGGTVAADDLACCGRRLYPPGRSQDPFLRMAERILEAPPDSTRGSPIRERLEHLLGLIETWGARGVVFHLVKFCEPELFDLPGLCKGLQDAGIPSVTVEIDLNDPLSNQALTRIEAFFEMIA
jgi:benzoyl-CoA reductase/2-hydroxyglutaryl-CoA dehydratase subunit BcrC/BadD/HgdB